MSSEAVFEFPMITDADIHRVTRLLKLPAHAFYGVDGSDPRQEALRRMDTIDIVACPGSGKTTLLVAKLAILAEKWRHGTQGICVLSHTNAARHEIESRLGNTAAGQRFLSYPHYIGTIHGFVNEFLALPLLRSFGYSGTRFDTEISSRKLLKLSGGGKKIPGYLYKRIKNESARVSAISHAHYVGKDLDIRLSSGNTNVPLKRASESNTFKTINEWKKAILTDGFASYEDTFAYGYFALKRYPLLKGILRDRFPLLFIDEAQDNSKEQSGILSRIFMEGAEPVIRQRFGDENQAIFDVQGAEEAVTDRFPRGNKVALPNSHRFSQSIADLADPLGVVPYGLQGLGPRKTHNSGALTDQHTIFLFDKCSATKIMDAYGELLLKTFSDLELREEGFFASAIGQVHKPPEQDVDHKFPHHIGHYWPDYDPTLVMSEPTPRTFIQYVFAGHGKSTLKGENHWMVEKIAEGFLRLSEFTANESSLARPKYQHRHVLQVLKSSHNIREKYLDLVVRFAVRRELLTYEAWSTHWRKTTRSIAEVIAGAPLSDEADAFLDWSGVSVALASSTDASNARNSMFRFRKDGREVFIRAGSIHSVKGQTHTATLVFETYWHKHNLEVLLPWLTRKRSGWKEADKVNQKSRLKLHYVAMTRPSHLLCLAMRSDTLDEKSAGELRDHGWRLLKVQNDGVTCPYE